MKEIRCPKCQRLLLKADGCGEVKCNRCKTIAEFNTDTDTVKERQ